MRVLPYFRYYSIPTHYRIKRVERKNALARPRRTDIGWPRAFRSVVAAAAANAIDVVVVAATQLRMYRADLPTVNCARTLRLAY